MNALRRLLVLSVLTAGVIVGASIPAWATFTDSVTLATTVATGTVAAPAWVNVNDSCTTTTTTVKRTVRTDPITGVQTQTAYSSTSSTVTSTTNVNYYSSTTAAGPAAYETTTTTVTQNTDLYVLVTWAASGSRGVNGYLINAHLADGSAFPMVQLAAGTVSTSQTVDADNLAYQPRLSVTTLTSYGWTARSAISGYISC
jgi:hypothetical protein